MRVAGSCALVTGSNRGLGAALVATLDAGGARRIHAAARDPAAIAGTDRIVPLRLDVTDDRSVRDAAARCGDVSLVINNAAAIANARLVGTADPAKAREEMETNFWGVLRVIQAFAPVLAANGGGAIVNILSIGALGNVPFAGSYCASKAAAWSLTQAARAELRGQGTAVIAVFAGPIATGMARAGKEGGRCPPALMAANILDGIARGDERIFPDPVSLGIAAAYAADPWEIVAKLGAKLD